MIDKMENKTHSKLWELLNSAFFLWFLSAIVLGSASFLYTKWNENKQIAFANNEKTRKLDLEISSRLSFFAEQILAKVNLKDALLVLEDPEKSDLPAGVFPEFSDRSLRALLWELQSLVPPNEEEEISNAIKETKSFNKIYLATIKYPNLLDSLFQSDEKRKEAKEEDGNNIQKESLELSEQNTAHTLSEKTKANDENVQINELDLIEIKPIHITVDVKLKIDRGVLDTTLVTFKVFNLERWGKPFQDIVLKTEISTRSNFDTKTMSQTSTPLFEDK